jgi:hypothetical protein
MGPAPGASGGTWGAGVACRLSRACAGCAASEREHSIKQRFILWSDFRRPHIIWYQKGNGGEPQNGRQCEVLRERVLGRERVQGGLGRARWGA